ncbi:class I SAM-dependent methyltransferase [Sphingopyxis sp. 550A]
MTESDDHPIDSQRSKHAPQNIYDEPIFFEGYRRLRQNDTGLNGALEVPALRALLPDLSGKHILDIGCGFGDFARHARSQGAHSVTALDVSENMISEAKRLTTDDNILYLKSSIEDFSPRHGQFDLVVSSMALHYVEEYAAVTRKVFNALSPEGRFIFSVEHPICTAHPVGWIRDAGGNLAAWPVDHYQREENAALHGL